MMVESAIKFDFDEAFKGIDGFSDAVKHHLPRSMAVAAGAVFRDEAKIRAPQGPTGNLGQAIYLAFSDNRSVPETGYAVYSVTWNKRKAPHGHLVEFGHWQTHASYLGKDGHWYSDPRKPLERPKWVPAHPFLRPAYDSVAQIALQASAERGRERLAEIMSDPAILEQYQ